MCSFLVNHLSEKILTGVPSNLHSDIIGDFYLPKAPIKAQPHEMMHRLTA